AALAARLPARTGQATTLVVIGTDAALTKAQCAKLSGAGHDGLARAINPVHTMFDGDTVFSLATGGLGAPDGPGFHALFTEAGTCVTRAVARAMLAASSTHELRSYRDTFRSAFPGSSSRPTP
ncbi:MAG: P1 family peptidase, partial [Acidimicrobiia bacterium]|nr:P1 family peptidase [Acidimicrobiia bacterium]